jgi:EpsI family protein
MNIANLQRARFWMLVVMLIGVTLFLRSRTGAENVPPRRELASFPLQVGEWKGREFLISEDIREVLGDGDFLQRTYRRSPDEPYIEFFIAYFPTQRTGSTIHSPKNCLPGSGWLPIESAHVPLRRPDGVTISVNRFIIQRGTNRQVVLYWYQSHDRVEASEYWAKFFLVADAIRLNRTDAALVRFITPQASGESIESAQGRATSFIEVVLPILPEFIPK